MTTNNVQPTVGIIGGAMPGIETFHCALRFMNARNVVEAHEYSSLE
jgi:hypothetical protein